MSLIEDLQNPENIDDKNTELKHVQTHISHVFIGDEFVYKMKKAVDFGFLDYSTLEKRKFYCEQEIELNKRLTKDIYIGILPVFKDEESYKIGIYSGDLVDYAVKMKRIPDEQLMKFVFEKGELTEEHLRKAAKKIADFHKVAATNSEIADFGKPEKFKINTDENFAQTKGFIGRSITSEEFETIQAWTENFFEQNQQLFNDRLKADKVRDCHGDLHLMHICFTENLDIIDCIEFNQRFRYSDVLLDVGFLMMDLDFLGGQKYSQKFWQFYQEFADEKQADELLKFYKIYRAYVRGKCHSFALDDANLSDEVKLEAQETAAKYFKLAVSYINS